MEIKPAIDVEAAYLDRQHEPAGVIASYLPDRLCADLSRYRGVHKVRDPMAEVAESRKGGFRQQSGHRDRRGLLCVFPARRAVPHADELHTSRCARRDGWLVPLRGYRCGTDSAGPRV